MQNINYIHNQQQLNQTNLNLNNINPNMIVPTNNKIINQIYMN